MRKQILQLVSVEPFFLWAGDVNAEETNRVFNMLDDTPSSTSLPDEPEGREASCAYEAEISAGSGPQHRSPFSY